MIRSNSLKEEAEVGRKEGESRGFHILGMEITDEDSPMERTQRPGKIEDVKKMISARARGATIRSRRLSLDQ